MRSKKFYKILPISIFVLVVSVLSGCSGNYIVLDPKGPVGEIQSNLIVISAVLLGVVILPVFVFLGFVVYRYRDKKGNKATFQPEWDDNKWLETIWWAIPIIVIGVLSIYTVRDTFVLAKPPSEDEKPITIQVTSLDWKWLFLYPEEGIATVNYIEIPTDRPIQFELTTDAPINSFWIPQLGGQKYTLPGKSSTLWLEADEEGSYFGTANNFSGEGFTEMKFDVIAKSEKDFNNWVNEVKESKPAFTMEDYAELSKPSIVEKQSYMSYPRGLFDYIVDKNGGQYYRSNKE